MNASPENGRPLRREIVLADGLYVIERDDRGRYFVSVPDGTREGGLTLEELSSLAKAIRKLARRARTAPPAPEGANGSVERDLI